LRTGFEDVSDVALAIQGFPQSNGHGRRQPGAEVVSRQSNLFVESSKKVSDAELRNLRSPK